MYCTKQTNVKKTWSLSSSPTAGRYEWLSLHNIVLYGITKGGYKTSNYTEKAVAFCVLAIQRRHTNGITAAFWRLYSSDEK